MMKKKSSSKSVRKPSATKKKSVPAKRARKPADEWEVDRLQLAKLMGVHQDTVSDYTAQGMPVLTRGGAGSKSSYHALECLAWLRRQQGQGKKEAAQTRAYEAQAELNEIKISLQKGEFLPRDEVVLAGQNYTKAWTAKVRALPRQMVQAGLISRDLEPAVTALLHALLNEISRWETVPDVEKVG